MVVKKKTSNFCSLLYKKYKLKITAYYLISFFRIFLENFLYSSFIQVLLYNVGVGNKEKGNEEKKKESNFLYYILSKGSIKFLGLGSTKINWWQFTAIGMFLVSSFFLCIYWEHMLETELGFVGGDFVKNLVLNKFRRLSFEGKHGYKNQLNILLQKDVQFFQSNWVHTNNHLFNTLTSIGFSTFFYRKDICRASWSQAFFFILWSGWILFLSNWFRVKNKSLNQIDLKKISEELEIIDEEISHVTLIEAKGLNEKFCDRYRKKSQQNLFFFLDNRYMRVLSWSLPYNFFGYLSPFFLFLLNHKDFQAKSVVFFWEIIRQCQNVFKFFRERNEYSLSYERIANFLRLPMERNDNLLGTQLSNDIHLRSIIFDKVSFRYQTQKEYLLKDYSQTFFANKINKLEGPNGFGKSTILYLILGLLRPQTGKIILEFANDKKYDLSEINLAHWRSTNVAFMSHETLEKKGSTGQKQITNISDTLLNKKDAILWLSDESDNALDKPHQVWLQKELDKLAQDKKIVIYISHKKTEE